MRLAALGSVAVLVVLVAAVVIFGGGNSDGQVRTEFALTGVGAAPAAGHAVAVLDDRAGGWAVDLDVSGLAPPPEGSYYECWYVGPGDTRGRPNRISAGTVRGGARWGGVAAHDDGRPAARVPDDDGEPRSPTTATRRGPGPRS